VLSSKPVLREVTNANVREIIALSDTLNESQSKCVAPNAVSVAQGSLSPAGWFRAIYLEEKAIGFVMVDLYPTGEFLAENEVPVFLWRFMIGRPWQKKGYGKQVLVLLEKHFRQKGINTIYTSIVQSAEENPFDFYIKFGFNDTGIDEEGERLLVYHFQPQKSTTERSTVVPSRSPLYELITPGINLLTIWTDQIAVMKDFYHGLLGFLIKSDLGDYVEFENCGVRFALCERAVMHSFNPTFSELARGQRFELAFSCEKPCDVDRCYEILISNSAGAVKAPADMPWGQRAAFFSDPDGNIHEIFADLAIDSGSDQA